MNRFVRLPIAVLLAVLLAAGLVLAANAGAAEKKPPKAEAPPPPGLNDPGVSTPAAGQKDAEAGAEAAPVPQADQDPLAPLPKPDSRLVRDKASRDAAANTERAAASEVTTRKQGDDTVEEYRQNGRVWMIKIKQPRGITQTFYDNDGSGRLTRDPHEGPVSPVYFTLYEWN